jgi:Pyridoxamine 5'-phosphate oxidase
LIAAVPGSNRLQVMASWNEIESSAPELAARARAAFDAHKHKVLATLRRDGSPRISGIEASFDDGELWLGMMPGSRKALDLRRDPRLALHSASVDPPDDPTGWAGDAKLAGRAVEVDDPALLERLGAGEQAEADPADRAHLFRVDITELVHTRVGDPADHLVIDLWQEGKGLRRMRRR